MKSLLLAFMLLLGAANAHAIVTAHCPEVIQTELSNYVAHEWESPSDFVLEGTLELTDKANSSCYYRNVSGVGEIKAARMEGSVKPGASASAYMVIYYQVKNTDYAAYMNISAMTEDNITIASAAGVYVATEICNYGCAPYHKKVGDAEFVYVADY